MSNYELVNNGAGWKLTCPQCGEVLYLDDDQFNGRISTWHDVPECGYHETINFSEHEAHPGSGGNDDE